MGNPWSNVHPGLHDMCIGRQARQDRCWPYRIHLHAALDSAPCNEHRSSDAETLC